MEGKATDILKDIMQKLSMINAEEVQEEVDNVEVVAEEVSAEVEVKEEVELSEEVEEVAEEEATELTEDSTEEATDEVSEELAEEEVEEEAAEELDEDKYVSRDEFDSKISELMDLIESMKGDMGKEKEMYEAEKAELSAQIEKLSAEPAAEPISHAPNQKQEQKEMIRYAQNRPSSTINRVFSKLN